MIYRHIFVFCVGTILRYTVIYKLMLEKILRRTIFCGIFTIPFIALIVDQSMVFPAITSKNFAFRIVVEIITGCWIALILTNKEFRPRRYPILIAFAIWVFIVAVANAHGVNPYLSFWGTYERMEGWITLAHLLMYLAVASSMLTTEKMWRSFFLTTFGVSAIVSIYALLQYFGFLAVDFDQQLPQFVGRVDATLGNPIFLAGYMIFHIFIGVLLWYQTWKESLGKKNTLYKIYSTIILLDVASLIFTGSRGALLGLVIGIIVTLIIFSFFAQKPYRSYFTTALCAMVAFFFAAYIIIGAPVSQDTGIGRLTNFSPQNSTIQSRILNIKMAWSGVKERPLLGWGQENYFIVFEKYYDPKISGVDLWENRVHNIILEWLINSGIFGLISYLAIFCITIWTIWKKNIFALPEGAILTGLLFAYFIQNLAVFDTITTYFLFTTILAYVVFRQQLRYENKPFFDEIIFSKSTLPIIVFLTGIVMAPLIFWINYPAFMANRTHVLAHSPQGDLSKNLQYYKQAIAYDSFGTQEIRIQLGIDVGDLVKVQSIPVAIKQEFFNFAHHEMQAAENFAPLDVRIPYYHGVLLDAAGDFTNAEISLQKAHNLAPKMQIILSEMVINAAARGDAAQALKYAKDNYNLEPSNSVAAQLYSKVLEAVANKNSSAGTGVNGPTQ